MKTPFSIALRIVLIIFAILSVTLGLAFGMSEYELTGHYVEIFEARRDIILVAPNTLTNLAKEPRRLRIQEQGNAPTREWSQESTPPIPELLDTSSKGEMHDSEKPRMQMGISRNIIMENASGSVTVYGNLKSESVSLDFIKSLPENSMVERSLEKDAYFFYSFSLPSGQKIVLYEPLEFLKTMRGSYALMSIFGLFFFSILLFVVSYRIAKDSLKPLEEAMERSRSYNRYMAHELKTPIAVISSNLELAKRSKDPMGYIDSSLDELFGMKSSIDKLLFLSGKEFQLQMKKTDTKPILDSLVLELGKLFGREDITWKVEVSNFEILTDPAFFRLLARNCLENIFKYAKSGEATIRISAHEMVFENSANPIDPQKLASFFEASESYGGKGYGIGLSIVKRIVDLHKWHVTLESADEKFRVKITL